MHPTLDKALINGEIIPLSEAVISLTHPVFLSSYGIYESIQIDAGRPFHLRDHLERLCTSARLLEMPIPQSVDCLWRWASRLVESLPPQDYSLQILAFGPDGPQIEPLIALFPRPINTYPPQFYKEGASAIIYEGQRMLPQSKSLNTLVNHLARRTARKQGALEAILTYDGLLTEGARSNLFAVSAETGRLMTPSADQVLSGVTREVVIQVMQETDHPAHEADLPRDMPMTEFFITSTSMHVMPITRLDGKPVGDGRVGPITRLAAEAFERYYQRHLPS